MSKNKSYQMSKVVKQFNSDQKRFLTSQIVGSTYNILITGALVTGFLLYMGIPIYYAGLLMSIPMLANVAQVLIDHIWNYFPKSGRMISVMVLSARLLILTIVFVPVLLHTSDLSSSHVTAMRIVGVAAIWLPAYILSAGSGIRMNFWMVSTFPAEYSSALLAYRDRIVIGISSVLSFIIAYYIDSLSGTKNEFYGYVLIFAIACMISITDFIILKDVKNTNAIEKKEEKPFVKCVRDIRDNKNFLRFECYIFLLNFSINIANPYFNAYMIDRLHLKYVSIMFLTILLAVTEIAVAGLWGKIGTEVTWGRILKWVTTVLGVQFIVWAFVTAQSVGLIIVIYITSGLIATGLSAAQFMLPYHYIGKENVFTYMSAHTAVVALGGFVGSVAGSLIISTLKNLNFLVLGFPFSSMQVNMLVSGFLILITTVYVPRVCK